MRGITSISIDGRTQLEAVTMQEKKNLNSRAWKTITFYQQIEVKKSIKNNNNKEGLWNR